MKILPINLKILNPISSFGINENIACNSAILTSAQDCFVPSFTSSDKTNKIDLSPALKESGIHCPACGTMMLSPNDYKKMLERVDKITNAQEFVDLLNDYKRFIPTNMRQILPENDDENYKNMTMHEYYSSRRRHAHFKRRDRINTAKLYISEYAKLLEGKDKEFVINAAESITPDIGYKSYKSIVDSIAENLKFDRLQAAQFSNKVLRPVASCNGYCSIFNIWNLQDYNNNIKNIHPNVLARNLIENIFGNSIAHITLLDKHPSYKDDPNNSIIECESCKKNTKSKVMFWRSSANPYLKDNIMNYLSDIAKLSGQGKIDNAQNYIKFVANLSNLYSFGAVNIDASDLSHIFNVTNLSSRHENFIPINQTKVDVPCACCGSTMLPHSMRLVIQEEMKKCDTPYDYAQILQKYDKYLGRYSAVPSKIFSDIVENNPNISKEDFLNKFRIEMDKYSAAKTSNAIKNYLKRRNYYLTNRPIEQLQKIDDVGMQIINYINFGKFDDYVYVKLFKECLEGIDIDKNGSKPIYLLLTDLKEIAYINSMSKKHENDWKDKDEIYSILFKMFSSDVATADHLVAAVKGGEGSKDNLIGLCKGCNSVIKSRKRVDSWYAQNRSIRKNLPEQLHIIDRMQKEGLLEGYDDWAKNIAEKMYILTNKKFDIREEFE